MKLKESKIRELIRQSIVELSDDAKKAKKMGLESKGFGNWVDPKSGQHYSSKGGKFHKVEDPKGNKKKEKPSLGTSIANKVQKNVDKFNKAKKDTPKSAQISAKGIENPFDKDDDSSSKDIGKAKAVLENQRLNNKS